MGSDWEFIVRVRVENLVDHDEVDAEALARMIIDAGNGFAGMTDWPDDWKILSAEPVE